MKSKSRYDEIVQGLNEALEHAKTGEGGRTRRLANNPDGSIDEIFVDYDGKKDDHDADWGNTEPVGNEIIEGEPE